MDIFTLLVPVFAIIATGFLFAYFNLLSDDVADSLIKFAMWVAIPALLFPVIAEEPFSELINPALFISFGGSVIIVFSLVFTFVLKWQQKSLGEASLTAFMAVGSNTAFVALPVLHALFGHRAVLPTAIATLMLIILILVTSVLLDSADAARSKSKKSLLSGFGAALLNPLVLSSILGFAYAATGLPLPEMAKQYLSLLAAAVTPCALFAIGLSIKIKDIRADAATMLVVSVIKLAVFPALVLSLAMLLDLKPIYTIAATICAAVPVGKTAFVLAEAHQEHPERIAATITVSSIVSIFTLTTWITLLAYIFPTALTG